MALEIKAQPVAVKCSEETIVPDCRPPCLARFRILKIGTWWLEWNQLLCGVLCWQSRSLPHTKRLKQLHLS